MIHSRKTHSTFGHNFGKYRTFSKFISQQISKETFYVFVIKTSNSNQVYYIIL